MTPNICHQEHSTLTNQSCSAGKEGPLSVRALSKSLERDYKNVHVDTSELEAIDLIQRTEDDLVVAPWDVIDAHFRLVA